MRQKDALLDPREQSIPADQSAIRFVADNDATLNSEYIFNDYVYVGEQVDAGLDFIQDISLNDYEVMWTAEAAPYRQYAAAGAEVADTAADSDLLAADIGADESAYTGNTAANWWVLGGTLLGAGILGATAFSKSSSGDSNHTTITGGTATAADASSQSDTATSGTSDQSAANSNASNGNTTAGSITDAPATIVDNGRVAALTFSEGLGSDAVLSNSDGLVTLNGNLSADDSALQNYLAQGWISQLQITIGEKTYLADVDTDSLTYHFQAQAADLAAAAGSPIRIELVESPVASLEATQLAGTYLLNHGQPTADGSAVQISLQDSLNGSVISGSPGSYTIAEGFSDTTLIGGSISGATTGDRVELSVNNQAYHAEVAADGTFSAAVRTADLAADSDRQVEARLLDNNGNAVAEGAQHYALAAESSGSNGQISAQNELPYFINALHNGATAQGYLGDSSKWAGIGSGLNISYAFDGGSGLDRTSGATLGNSLAFSNQQMADIKALLSKISEYANIIFTEAADTGSADLAFYLDDLGSAGLANSYGYAYTGGDVHFSSTLYGADDAFSKGDGPLTVLHETLHSLGFEHPFELGDNNSETLAEQENSTEFTLLSYNCADLAKTNDLRAFDLAALHYNYGVNSSQRSGNDVYTFNAFNRGTADGGIYVWDGAGIDTFDASAAEAGVTVNLTPGSWNYIGEKSQYLAATGSENVDYSTLLGTSADSHIIDGWNNTTNSANYVTGTQQAVYATGQSFIGYGTQIENLMGSAHNDTLTGNDADNQIEGGAGNDTLVGGAGNDSLIGGAGDDHMSGGLGDDSYYVDSSGDVVTEQAGEGVDTVYSTVDHTLGAHQENLTLLGATDIRGTGNDGDNIITGNSGSNWLKGGLGNDTLTGGGGADYFVFDDLPNSGIDTLTDFSYGSDKLAFSDLLFDSADINLDGFIAFHNEQVNANTRLIYNSSEQSLAYDADGSGSGSAVTFANLALDDQTEAAKLISLVSQV